MNSDIASRWIDAGCRTLTFYYPIRSAVGYILGAFLWVLTGAYPGIITFLAMEPNSSAKASVSIFGFLLCQIKTMFDAITGKGISEELQRVVNLIDKSNLSDMQKRIKYKEMIDAEIGKLSKSTSSSKGEEKKPQTEE
ncbi:MAG: hypothetical protein LBE90_04235 [Pantoea dispersa]|jgi:hypothetical protein|nr:hypothetical protein [Pantoea dispersa]MBZ6389696.1 hypothetical protein [Pantoea dispersa]